MTNPATMTVQECCMFVAQEKGWTYHESARVWTHKDDNAASIKLFCAGLLPDRGDPFPPTIDSAAAAMPKFDVLSVTVWPRTTTKTGVVFEPKVTCVAYKGDDSNDERLRGVLGKAEGDTELLARWRLVVACMLAEKEGSNER